MAVDVSLVMTLDDQGRIQLGKISKEYGDAFENLKNDVNKRLGGIQQSINNMNAAFNNRPTILRYAESFGTGLRTMVDTARTGFTSIGSYVSRFLFGSQEKNELGQFVAKTNGLIGSLRDTAKGAAAELSRIGPTLMGIVGIGGIGGFGMLAKGTIQARMELERYTTEFDVLFKEKARSAQVMAQVIDFAAKTPFQLPEVIQATRILETLTKGALSNVEGLRMVGDAASATGIRINELAMWFGRLYDGLKSGRPVGEATMRMQEMGIMSGDVRNRIESMQKAGKSGAEVWKMVADSFGRYAGMMEEKSKTLEGKLSNIQDAWWRMKTVIADQVFPELKKTADDVMKAMESAITDGTAKNIGNALAGMFEGVKVGIQFIKDNWTTISSMLAMGAVFAGTMGVLHLMANPLVRMIALSVGLVKVWEAFGGNKVSVLGTVMQMLNEIASGFQFLKDMQTERQTGNTPVTELQRRLELLSAVNKQYESLYNTLKNKTGPLTAFEQDQLATLSANKMRERALRESIESAKQRGDDVEGIAGRIKKIQDSFGGVKEWSQKDLLDAMKSDMEQFVGAIAGSVNKLKNDITPPVNDISAKLKNMIPLAREAKKPVEEAIGGIRGALTMPKTTFGPEQQLQPWQPTMLSAKEMPAIDKVSMADNMAASYKYAFNVGIERAMTETYGMATLIENYGRDMATAFHEGFSSTLVSLMSGASDIKDAFKSMVDELGSLSKRFVADSITTNFDKWMKSLQPKMAGMVAGIMQTVSGMFEDSSTRGSSIGSGIGMIAGSMIGGPIGTTIGGLAGGLLGGLFNKDEDTKKAIQDTADNTAEMATQLEVVNRNLIGLRNQLETYPLPTSAYFSARSTEEKLALELAM